MYNPDFTIYTNYHIEVAGAISTLRIVAITPNGFEYNVTSGSQKRVRVYDYDRKHGDNQPFADFDMPAYIGGPSDWTENPELAKAIAKEFPKSDNRI